MFRSAICFRRVEHTTYVVEHTTYYKEGYNLSVCPREPNLWSVCALMNNRIL